MKLKFNWKNIQLKQPKRVLIEPTHGGMARQSWHSLSAWRRSPSQALTGCSVE